MKILHKSKRAVPPPPPVVELITKLQSTTNEELAIALSEITVWKWQRSDLNAWIKVLNKFDVILEEIIRDCSIDKLQTEPFTPMQRSLLFEILRFERLLLENSTNRKMYNSYDRLNSLLFTSDLEVLILTLKLLLRPSQQYSAQPAVSQSLSISTPRLQSLAKRWPQLREYSVGLVDLAVPNNTFDVAALPAEAREVHFSFYRTEASSTSDKDKPMDTDTPEASSSTVSKSQAGAVTLHIDESALQAKSEMAVLADAVERYSVPDSEKFELLCRIRAASVLQKGREADREKLLVIRLLAIAIFGHTHPETQASSSIFLYEPDLIIHVAELLHTDKHIPTLVQTAAVAALDALARYRSKMQEVLTSVNAGVNHGILMGLLRKTVADITSPESSIPNSFVEALLAFLSLLASHAAGGNMVVGAGLIPLLIQILENRHPDRLPVLSKTMQLVDNVLYSFTNAFNLFCTSRGVDVLVERIEFEINHNIKEHGDQQKSREIYGSHTEIPVARAAVLKHILRSMHRMMQSSGTSEGLRGLIDTSILKSIKKIIEYRGLFGASVLPIAINIMATFVHNEPTSLVVIQEAGLPEAFYKAIELGLEPAIEVIQAIPNAIGALCLNEVGQAQLTARPSIIPSIFSIFTSDRHLKVLLEKENAVLMGTTIDELIRHHPQLKAAVFESIRVTLSKIEDLGNAFEAPEDIKQWYKLVPTPTPEEDITMEDMQATGEAPQSRSADAATSSEEPATKAHDNHIVSFIDVLGRFLEGLFQHAPHCKDFMNTKDGMASLGRLTALPCLPYDYANSIASDSMVQIMRTMTEAATSETLLHLATLVKESLQLTQDYWSTFEDQSKLLQFVDLNNEDEVNANFYFRNLVTLHIRITLLSDVFATAGYAHGRQAIVLLQTLMTSITPQVVKDLGALHRTSIWENIVLKMGLAAKGIDVERSPPLSLEGSPDQPAVGLPENNGHSTSATANGAIDGVTEDANPTAATSTPKESGLPKAATSRENNATALKHMTNGLPSALAPFFQAMVKMFHARRAFDASQRKQMAESSAVVAEILLQHLTVKHLGDKPSTFTYYSIVLGLITLLLVDERTASSTLHTVQLLALYRANGLEAIFDVCQGFISSIDSISPIREDTRTEAQSTELGHAYGGLKVALHLIHPIISSKPLFESGQTPLLITRDVKDTDPQYFEPHNFLVRLRMVALPFLSSIWEAKWLVNAPLTVSRFVVQAVLELVNGDGEEAKGDSDVGPIPGVPRTTGTDENRIRQLTDMGFPRSAAERALVRTHNNVNAATELLLAHPYPFPPDPEPEAEPTAQALSTDAVAPSADDVEPAPSASETPEPVAPLGRTADEWRAELNEARESLRAGVSRQALVLVDEHLSLIFDLHVAFVKPAGPNQVKSVQILVDDIKAFSPYAYDVQEQPLANRCRLLALVLCETPGTLGPDLRATLMDSLLALLLSNPVSINTEQPTIPRWLAAHLLVTEALFTLADEPRAITLPKEDEAIASEPIPTGPPLNEARTMVFDFCLRLLAIPNLPSDELLSTLRLLVLLTRDHGMASQFVTRDGMDMLFRRLKSSPVNGSSSYIATILRHIVEDASVVSHIMHQSIKRYFTQLRGRVTEPTTYVRNCSAMALRNAELFIETTQSLCQVTSPYSSNPHLSLKAEPPKSTVESGPSTVPASGTTEMQVDSTTSALPPPKPSVVTDAAVHYLIGELIAVYKSLMDRQPETSSENDKDAGSKDKTQFMCFMMQCLTELLFSYDSCKSAFLSYSPKKPRISGVSKDNTKHRTHTLSFFLNDLVAYENLNAQKDTDSQNRMQICNWAMSVLVALCVDSSSTHEPKEVSPSLVSVRKTVLDAISRTIKDLPSADSLPSRYGRLLAIGDLCHRLLTVRFNHASSRKQHDDGPTHIAKVMLEKAFVSTLTGALSEVDLNYPNIRTLVQSIMRPLEHLTKVAIKMSRASSKSKDVAEEVKSDSEDSMASDESDDDDRREETPDLYRNSALGIYAGEMDGGHPDDDDMEDDEDDMVDDDEMDFGDETGSDDTSNTDEEGDDDEEMDEPIPNENDWENEDDEEDEEDDLVHNEEEGGEDEDDEDDEDDGGEPGGGLDDEDAEILWQDMHGVNAEAPALGEDGDEDDEVAGPIHIIHEDEEDEPEMASDEDDFGQDMDGPDFVGGIFGFTDSARDGAGIFVPRRHRSSDENVQVFGRPRNGAAPPPETTTHPLLLDASATGQRSQSRLTRAPQGRFVAEGGDILQTIEQLVGGGAFQFFQQIMARGGRGGAGPEQTIRLDVPPGTLMNLDRGFLQRRQPIISASVRVERNGRNASQARDLDPLLTLQRWTEEVKILHGDFVSERVVKLANHVTLALLPAAVEAAKLAKIQSDELARQKEEDVKAAAEKAAEAAKAEAEAAKQTEPASAVTMEDSGAEQALPSSSEGISIVIDHPMEDAVPVNVSDPDTEMIDGTITTEPPTNESAGSSGASAEVTVERSTGESSTASARVTVLIHGNAVDITDTGIDPTFLEALPDDMREEVLNQHIRDQRAARVERPPDSHISAEFLDALPPELRAEIIQQEAIERSQRRRDNPPADNAPGPTEIDPASFIASLDPNLRQAILLDQDDGFIQTLPSHMIAEAGAYREGLPRAFRSGNLSPRPPSGSASRKQPPPPHDAIQLLDRQGVAILIRLLFFPQVIKKNLLFKVLLNLCENAKTRTELFNLLLNILQDGTGDLTAVDKSFAQMSFRNSKPVKAVGKQKGSPDYAAVLALPSAQNEAIPDLIAQRCLDALVYIVTANGAASLFFLTEHEVPAGLRRAPSKKGKGKEKQTSQTHYPIVLLLGLLDRQSLLRTPSIVESVVGLLATVTRPLGTLKENKKTPISSEPLASSSTIPPPETVSGVSLPAAGSLPQSEEPSLLQGSSTPPPSVPASNDAPPPAPVPVENKDKIETVEQKILLANPPQIPHVVLRFIVNILTVGECSARTFQQSLALIQHLSNIPDARDVIAQELKSKAQEFGQSLLMELDELATALLSAEGEVLVGAVASKFSAPSSVQAKLLRVLKTIDYMYSPRASNATSSEGEEDTEKVQSIYESFRFTPLWKRLGDCLAIIEEKSDTEHVATVLLPLIEALMVVCKYVGPKSASSSVARALRGSSSPKSPTTPAEAMEDLFVTFTDAHRKILNLMVRNNPSLMSGSFSLLVHNPRVLDFDNKRNYFSQQLHRRPHAREHHSTLQLNVRRARVFEDSFQHLQRKTGDQIKYGKLSIRFYEEEGVDAGGLTREWFQILARQMFDPNNALFQPCAADKLTYQPNKNSWVNPEHLSFFKFVGRVIGKAIYDGRLLDAYFARSLYRQILGKPVDYKDVEWVDPEYYNSLCWILENDPTLLELTFSVESDEFGVNRIFDLKEGGASIPVTQDNKREFVQLSAQFRLYSSIQQQIEHLLNGFYEIIPKDLINIFNEQELELLISGTPDIDVDEWRAATEYNGYTSSDPNIVWWWRALKSFNREERAKVLSFATGTSRVPLNGFNDLQGVQGVQKFSIHRAYGESDRLPQAHTCFNQIDLPQYSSYDMLRQQVLLAISEGGEGFGFV